MHFNEYRRHDGLALAALVARKEVSAAELLSVALARMNEVNPRLNAVVVCMDEIARQRCTQNLHGPFAGVPFLGKNLKQDHAGVVSACGNQALKQQGRPAPHHAEITRRWLAAGVVMLGQTNTPEFGLSPFTEPLAFGPTHNPWQQGLSAGGSSGGSAAAVAAGIVPLAGGNDVGGSIRIPASACGLFGFKPGRGRTPWGPEVGEMMHGAAVQHVLTRSVRDSAAMLDATCSPELPAPFVLRPPERPYLDEVSREPGRLRIAFCTRSPLNTPVSADAVAAVHHTARRLEALGHHVEEAEPAIDGELFFNDVMTLMYAHAARFIDETRNAIGSGRADFEPQTRVFARLGRALRADEFAHSLTRWQHWQREVNTFLTAHDVYLTPTVAEVGPRHGALALPQAEYWMVSVLQALGGSRWMLGSQALQGKERATLQLIPFTPLANLTGCPAMSVPLHWTAEGLPLGMQFMAAPSGEGLLFRLAGQLERDQPWFAQVPMI